MRESVRESDRDRGKGTEEKRQKERDGGTETERQRQFHRCIAGNSFISVCLHWAVCSCLLSYLRAIRTHVVRCPWLSRIRYNAV